jgi:hypothetical protein
MSRVGDRIPGHQSRNGSSYKEETMNTKKLWSVVFSIVVGCAVFLPLAQASEQDEKMELSFSQPVEIPGHVLPAGTYQFVLIGDLPNRDEMGVYSADGETLYATVSTIPAERLKPDDRVTVTFAKREPSNPEAVLKVFYPGSLTGHEFLYPKQAEKEISKDQQQLVVAPPMDKRQVQAGF